MRKKVAIIGAGISGLALSKMLVEKGINVTVYESDSRPGGLIKCDIVDNVLYHRVGGHVFNSRRKDILDWFWSHFNKKEDFIPAKRHATISLENGQCIDYPIENHIYQFNAATRSNIIRELLEIAINESTPPKTLGDFFKARFGDTLNNLYFTPYNSKIWGRDISDMPINWLEGKLPMPTVEEIFDANIGRVDESRMVHSSFFYAKHGGSQFLADTLAEGLNIQYNKQIKQLTYTTDDKWVVDNQTYDMVFYTGNIKGLPEMVKNLNELLHLKKEIDALEYHGTTSVLCEIDKNAYSWIYMPSLSHGSHRIICTGNFSPYNAPEKELTATIEFSIEMNKAKIEQELAKIPFHPRYLAHHYEPCTYPVQTDSTRATIKKVKNIMEPKGLYLVGRFAEWEYYNMDAAIGAAKDFIDNLR